MKKGLIVLVLLLVSILLISGCAEKECKTDADCLAKTCFTVQCLDNLCSYSSVTDCCGNDVCEVGETYPDCADDCPNCDDVNECTIDDYDYHEQKCINAPIIDRICCGNSVCETGETYSNCAKDCPDCNDDNTCTKDSYDYHEQKCINEPITPCCGNGICDEDVEIYSSCPTDCPNCDDNNKLTGDSFNYVTQKCKYVTYYFFEDFEAGETGIDRGENWRVIDEQGNKVFDCPGKKLNGIETDWAKFGDENWAGYTSELQFKLVDNYEGFGFHFFSKNEQSYVVDIRRGEISLKKESPQGREKVSSGNFYFNLNSWYTLKTEKVGNNIKIYIDNLIVLEYVDSQPLDTGQLRIETFGDGYVRLDNVVIIPAA